MIQKTILLIIVLNCFNTIKADVHENIDQTCEPQNLNCYQVILDNTVKRPVQESINKAIALISGLQTHQAWKNNALGVLYMLKKDSVNLNKAENFLKNAYNQGVRSSAQNLAELYFLKEDITESLRYIKIVESFQYQYPDKKYINWARLYGQLLYLSASNRNKKNEGLELFRKIRGHDDSGVSHYLIGFDEVFNGDIKYGIDCLVRASELGRVDAIMLLGDIYYEGSRVKKDIVKAKEFYLKGAKTNSGRAHYNLAMIYKEERNASEMRKHLIAASQLGNESALKLYSQLKNK